MNGRTQFSPVGEHRRLPLPRPGPAAATTFVREHLGHVVNENPEDIRCSPAFRGGQQAADRALAAFEVTGYAKRRNEVFPDDRRGASFLSPYIRHGLLSLRSVWDAVQDGPPRDVAKFRDELLWQEFARHWYARLGSQTRRGVRNEVSAESIVLASVEVPTGLEVATGWAGSDSQMACLAATQRELETDGWLVNQTRMWLASQWTVRQGQPWQEGEDLFFRHLLDGSRAANRLGWQWTTGAGSSKSYGFSRWQVNKRAPGLCDTCSLRSACPIEEWPDDPVLRRSQDEAIASRVRADADPAATAGPDEAQRTGTALAVWLTAESLGFDDPALAANPDLPAVFVFDESLLAGLQLSAKRLIFLVETLAELGETRPLDLWLGDPAEVLGGNDVAVTFAPVPGFRRKASVVQPVEVHPWPWLLRPGAGAVTSFSAWRKSVAD